MNDEQKNDGQQNEGQKGEGQQSKEQQKTVTRSQGVDLRKTTGLPLPSVFYNTITMLGAGLAALSFGLIVFLMVIEFLTEDHRPYMGIVAFVILPIFLIIGLLLVAVGAIRENRRRKHGLPATQKLPKIDLNDPKQFRATAIFAGGTILLLGLSAFGSFKAYEYTDSDEFCGTVCHTVMEPEYVAYNNSPHARVGCVNCHIGPGTEWFVRSKLSGAYQLYAVAADVYPRPIHTPIKNLRPSRDICEQCHWPEHFSSDNLFIRDYYALDEQNSHWSLRMLMKIGGGDTEGGPQHGIHWHMNVANEIQYVATDERRLEIPWVKAIRPDGSEVVFRNTESDFTEDDLADHPIRRMDCIDCHNRPAHRYQPPTKLVNRAMALGFVDRDLPWIKEKAVELLDAEYETKEEALSAIEDEIRGYYREDYPGIAGSKSGAIDDTIAELQRLYSTNFFPVMKTSWKSFPEHIGHLWSPGCFRCHNGTHESEDGEVLTRDCNACHSILAQETLSHQQLVNIDGEEYRHPVDIDEAWKEMACTECHEP